MSDTLAQARNSDMATFESGVPTVTLQGLAFAAITEEACVRHVFDELDAGRGGWIVTVNLDILRKCVIGGETAPLVNEATMVVADGAPIIWASRLQGTPLPERIAGSSLVWTLSEAASKRGRSIFLLGGDDGVAEKAADELRRRYPGLKIAGAYCPPVGFERDQEEIASIREALSQSGADMVYVALGSPKQEALIHEMRQELPGAWWVGVGISLSFVSGEALRAPIWMQRTGLEWAHRFAQEPRRLARRYLVDGAPFAIRFLIRSALRRGGISDGDKT